MAVLVGVCQSGLKTCAWLQSLIFNIQSVLFARIRLVQSQLKPACILFGLGLLGACSDSITNDTGTESGGGAAPTPTKVIPDVVLLNPISTVPGIKPPATINTAPGAMPVTPGDTPASAAQLAKRLQNNFNLDGQRLVPTTGWICKDVFEQNRIYYFYPEGVLDAGRKVVVERTLIANDQLNDLRFFWSASGADSILMSSTTIGDDGVMLSSGTQYDINTIRFTAVGSVESFSAQSLLRGKLVCANFDLQ